MTSQQLEMMKILETERSNRAQEAIKEGALLLEREKQPYEIQRLQADITNTLERLGYDTALTEAKTLAQELANVILRVDQLGDYGAVQDYFMSRGYEPADAQLQSSLRQAERFANTLGLGSKAKGVLEMITKLA